MKFFIVFALCVAAASARFIVPDVAAAEAAEIKEILAAINNPSTDPATAAALQQLLNDFLGIQGSPIHVGPVIVDENDGSPIHVGPVIVDENDGSPIHVGPVIVDENDGSPIHVGPVIVDENDGSPIHVGPAIIDESDLIDVSPVIVDEQSPSSSPLVQIIINVNSGASVAESPVDIEPTPVIVVDNLEDIDDAEKPIIDAPVFPGPAVVPDTLN